MRLNRRFLFCLVAFCACRDFLSRVSAAPDTIGEKPAVGAANAKAKLAEPAAGASVEKATADKPGVRDLDKPAVEKPPAGVVKETAAVIPGVEQEFEIKEEKAEKWSAVDEAVEESRGAAVAAKPFKEQATKEGEDSTLVREWDKHMEGFVPELLLTFPLPARTDEFFYEDVGDQPVLLRGGFFASSEEEDSSVDFQITDPTGDVVFEKSGEAEGLFHFLSAKNGTYTFAVSNSKWMQQKVITFAMGKGNDTHLQAEHLDTIDSHVKSIDRTLKDIQTESTYLWIRQKSHMKTVESIHRRVFWFCVVEFLILIGVSGFQVFYIKGLLSDRRVL